MSIEIGIVTIDLRGALQMSRLDVTVVKFVLSNQRVSR